MEAFILVIIGVVMAGLLVWLRHAFLSFRGQNPADYEGLGPEFDLRDQLSGDLICEGVIYGPTGRVTSRFVARMRGEWDGNRGVLNEDFRYDNGAVQERAWYLTLGENGRFTSRAEDIEGIGEGRQSGPTVRLDYRIRLPEDSGGHLLTAVDWMYLLENGTIINRSQFRKYGLKVAELVATIRKEDRT